MKKIKTKTAFRIFFSIIAVLVTVIILESCASKKIVYKVHDCPTWANSINNPENEEFVAETAFNLGINDYQVTQQQFDERYLKH